ncbi:MAG: MBL fold metallo-hydrolase [Acidobacteria bacterium]|nr:MBL fold metallo-hydrolase [Acidobacteriota bacterium]
MRRILLFWLPLMVGAVLLRAAPNTLDIYYIDVEGGAATLIVTPAGESLLVDFGWRRADNRDAKRIYEVATRQAGLKKIDYALTTHFHMDHVGGLPALAKMIPIGKFLDHGDRVEAGGGADAENWAAYQKLATPGERVSLKPGDRIPLKGVDVVVVASDGEVIPTPINGGGPNEALCKDAKLKEADPTENARSAGFLLSFGTFQFLDLGDLTWNKENELACPQNRLGKIDLLQVTHHGMDMSGAPQHIWAIRPQVAIFNNGPLKGGTSVVYDTVKKSPGIEAIWQVHRALQADQAHNTAEPMTANLEPEAQCRGHWLKVSVESDGKYTVTNSRNGFSKTYTAR